MGVRRLGLVSTLKGVATMPKDQTTAVPTINCVFFFSCRAQRPRIIRFTLISCLMPYGTQDVVFRLLSDLREEPTYSKKECGKMPRKALSSLSLLPRILATAWIQRHQSIPRWRCEHALFFASLLPKPVSNFFPAMLSVN